MEKYPNKKLELKINALDWHFRSGDGNKTKHYRDTPKSEQADKLNQV